MNKGILSSCFTYIIFFPEIPVELPRKGSSLFNLDPQAIETVYRRIYRDIESVLSIYSVPSVFHISFQNYVDFRFPLGNFCLSNPFSLTKNIVGCPKATTKIGQLLAYVTTFIPNEFFLLSFEFKKFVWQAKEHKFCIVSVAFYCYHLSFE